MFKRAFCESLPTPHTRTHWRINHRRFLKTGTCLIALLSLVLLSVTAFGQTAASLSGSVMDASRGVLTNATITAVNDDTGVETKTTTNNSGIYNFGSLQPGTYRVSAELSGFQKYTNTGVKIGAGSQSNLNFELAVAGMTTEVEVTANVESMILEAGSSTGSVLQEELVAQLPTFTGNALELVNIMGGVVMPPASVNPLFEADRATFAGVSAQNINITRDGISQNEVRYNSGVQSSTRMNTEIVGEFKMVLSPVDAELGRGAGQVQITTRSGSNAFHGSAVWNIQNTALDANEWQNKNRPVIVRPNWRNLNNYSITASGPIIQNKTFFFANWDQQWAITRTPVNTTVLTNCARKGIYRYLENVTSTNALLSDTNPRINGANRTIYNDAGVAGNVYAIGVERPGVWDGSDGQHKPGEPRLSWTFGPEDRFRHATGTTLPINNPNLGSLDFRNQTVTNRLMYNSILGEMDPNVRVRLGGSPDQYAAEGSWVYNGCPDDTYSIQTGQRGYNNTSWDYYRRGVSNHDFVMQFTDMMPQANDFAQTGDGLNTATRRWTRTLRGNDTTYGTGDSYRKAITVKIDHNINAQHRLSGTYTYEAARSQNQYVVQVWENGWGGSVDRWPQTFTTVLTSTLSPTLLSEFRVGLSRNKSYDSSALGKITKSGAEVKELLQKMFPTDGSDGRPWKDTEVILPAAGSTFPGPYGHFYGNASTTSWGSVDPRWTFSENLTWMRGAHSFKGGIEYRRSKSYQNDAGAAITASSTNIVPTIQGGVNPTFTPSGWSADRNGNPVNATTATGGPLTGLSVDPVTGAKIRWNGLSAYEMTDYGSGQTMVSKLSNAYTLMNYLSGGVNQVWQYFYVVDSRDPRWNDLSKGENERYSDLKNIEMSFFFKDDWKFNNSLTLNLGARWEYYGVPFEGKGKIGNVMDGWDGMFGISRGLPRFLNDFDTLNQDKFKNPNWASQGTQQIFVGPNSPHPDMMAFNKDRNNWAPHIGFSWQLPWFGKGKTTLRGGYSISYLTIGTFTSFRGLSSQPGVSYNYYYAGSEGCISGQTGCNMNLDNVNQLLPLDMSRTGQLPLSHPDRILTNKTRESTLNLYDPNIRNPYVQNINMSLTRSLNSFLTLDVRYVGTLSRKALGSMPNNPSGSGYVGGTLNLNTPNYYNNGLFSELLKLRSGLCDNRACNLNSYDDFPVLNRVIPWKDHPDLNGVTQNTASLYAVNSGGRLVDELSGAEQLLYYQFDNIARGAFQTVVNNLATADYHTTLTNSGRRTTRPLTETASGQVLKNHGAPANLIYNNPQFERVNVFTNYGKSNYHSMQTQLTMRPWRGLSLQATWTWSRNLGRGADILDYREDSPYYFEREYTLTGQHRLHSLNTYGSYTLPFGARGYLFRNASGAFKKTIEGWQLSWIASVTSGAPMSFTGISSMWDANNVVQVGAFDAKNVGVNWRNDSNNEFGRPYGTYFDKEYKWVPDPQCTDSSLVSQTTRNPYGSSNTLANMCSGTAGGSLFAIAEAETGTIIFQNARPGDIGNKANRFITGPRRWTLDMSMAKSVEFMEGKRLEIRMDAQNIMNHASPSFRTSPNPAYNDPRNVIISDPNVVLNDTNFSGGSHPYPFGYLNAKGGHRTFQGKIRLSF